MARRRSNMSLMRAAGNGPQERNRVAAQEINNGSSSNGSVVRIRTFVGDDFDRYLARLGLVKKTMPNTNGSSLYRAVCESLSYNQREFPALQQLVEEHLLFQYHIQRIENGLARVNKIEDSLTTVAHLLSIDLIVYREVNEKPVVYKGSLEGERAEKVMLCETSRGHFDLVIRREDHANLALAQSILYEALYIGVFGFSRETIKESIAKVREDMDAVGVDVQTPTSDDVPGQPTDDFSFNDGSNHSSALAWRPPIPYSSIKALDPSVYRNLSYDLFLKNKRQKGDYGIFRSGSPCLIMEGESCYRAFVLSVPDKHSRMVLVNGIERRVSVSRLLPLSCHISPIQTVPSSRFATNTEHSETAQTAPPREIFPWLSVVPFSYEYWTETFTVQYLCQMRPNGCVTPSSNFAYVNYPWSYAGSVSSCESTSVFVGVPLDSSYEYMASRSFEHRAAAMVPYNAGFHFVSGSLQNSALCY
uniref:KH domain-containing protein n=1 Tax=Haemonchus contortus TaxID=6289 RepID=A0A7I4XWF6_HAECO